MLGRMAQINFGDGRELRIVIESPIAIFKGAGVHRLQFPVTLDVRNTIKTGVPFTLSGQAWLGTVGGDWLGPWFMLADPNQMLVVQRFGAFDATIVLPLTDEQLAVIEQRRASSEFMSFWFDVQIVLGYDPDVAAGPAEKHWPARVVQAHVDVYADQWVRLLRQAGAGTSLAVVVPVPLDGSPAHAVGTALREALRKVGDREWGDAATAARKAIEEIDHLHGKWPTLKEIADVNRDDRTLDQRLALLRHGLHAIASLSPHTGPVPASVNWDREKALAVIAGVAALAACRGTHPAALASRGFVADLPLLQFASPPDDSHVPSRDPAGPAPGLARRRRALDQCEERANTRACRAKGSTSNGLNGITAPGSRTPLPWRRTSACSSKPCGPFQLQFELQFTRVQGRPRKYIDSADLHR
jgi:hypothetical protein